MLISQGEQTWPGGQTLDWYPDDIGSIPRFGCPLFSELVICGHRLVTLPLTINKTFKCLSSMPILMRKSFWW